MTLRSGFRSALLAIVLLAPVASFLRAADSPPLPAHFTLPTMKTSIYVGSVTLVTGTFTLSGDNYTSTYEAKVSPWSFWSESGTVALDVTAADYERLLRGERIEISGEATNGKGKLRQVTARADPHDATSGDIKVRISASGTTLVFNGTYTVAPAGTPAREVAAAE